MCAIGSGVDVSWIQGDEFLQNVSLFAPLQPTDVKQACMPVSVNLTGLTNFRMVYAVARLQFETDPIDVGAQTRQVPLAQSRRSRMGTWPSLFSSAKEPRGERASGETVIARQNDRRPTQQRDVGAKEELGRRITKGSAKTADLVGDMPQMKRHLRHHWDNTLRV